MASVESLLKECGHNVRAAIALQLIAEPALIARTQMACKLLNHEYDDNVVWKSACLLQVRTGKCMVGRSLYNL